MGFTDTDLGVLGVDGVDRSVRMEYTVPLERFRAMDLVIKRVCVLGAIMVLGTPKALTYTRTVPGSRECPFKHTVLNISKYPILNRKDAHSMLTIRTVYPKYLGPVCTIADVAQLLAHTVSAMQVQFLPYILDMHTRLQVHPCVPRTFALHLVGIPSNADGIGLFVGESAGE